MKTTFALIKPCAQARGDAPKMQAVIRNAGFSIERQREITLSREQAEWLYREHAEKSHFNDLVDFTISGPVTIMQLSSPNEDTPSRFRDLMGPTDISKAGPETLRGQFAEDFRRNSIHGSDGNETAKAELAHFSPAF